MKDKFPIFKNHADLVFLDNAASTQKPKIVIDTIKDYYENHNANVHRGLYKLSEEATNRYEHARGSVAQFINSLTEEVIFTQGTTDSINALAEMYRNEINEGDIIVTSELEHHSNILPWQKIANERKAKLKYIKLDSNLEFDLEQFEEILKTGKVKIVNITAMSNVTGYISPTKQITELSHKYGAIVHVDGAQIIAHKQIDVKDLDVDFLCFSGHKLYGPTGIGVLYGKKEILEKLEPFKLGGGMIREVFRDNSTWAETPEKFEAGTPNIVGAIGLGAAIEFVKNIGFKKIEAHENELRDYSIQKLNDLDYLKLFTPKNKNVSSGVISFEFKNVHPHDVAQILDQHNIAIRAGHHCCQILMKDVLKVQSTSRVSLGIYNEKEDIDKLIIGLKEVSDVFR